MFKQGLYQKQLQRLTPQKLMTIRLLQIPHLGLEQRIKLELEKNPMLEEVEDDSLDEEQALDEILEDWNKSAVYNQSQMSASTAQEYRDNRFANLTEEESIYDDLNAQLGCMMLSDRQILVGEQIIGNLDENGFFRRDINSMVDDLAFKQGFMVENKEVEEVLSLIQNELSPPGIAARNVQECLLLQVNQDAEIQDDFKQKVVLLLKKYFEEYSNKNYPRILSGMNVSEDELKAIDAYVKNLNAKPFLHQDSRADRLSSGRIFPDAILEINQKGDFVVSLAGNPAKRLKISPHYIDILNTFRQEGEEKDVQSHVEASKFIKEKIEEAELFISSLNERQSTIEKVILAIANYQKKYFTNNEDIAFLKSMKLQDIAELTELDKSTISRVVSAKYVATPKGIFPLKFYFSEEAKSKGEEDANISNKVVKDRLKQLVAEEDAHKPLKDEDLLEILIKENFLLTRRTVAKYRKELDIPVARLRKKI